MSKEQKISIIIPTYNSQDTIKRCLAAIYNSSYSSHEVIVVDDNSSDHTAAILEDFPAKVIKSEIHQFQAVSRNKGAKAATGDLFLFIDSDIEIKRNSIESAVNLMNQVNASAVTGVYDAFNPYRNVFSQYKHLYMTYNVLGPAEWIQWPNTSFLLISKEAFWSVGGFNEKVREAVCEDLEFGIRLAKTDHRIFLGQDIMVVHNRHLTMLSFIIVEYKRARAITGFNISNLISFGRLVRWPVKASFRISFLLLPLFYYLCVQMLLHRHQASFMFVSLLILLFLANLRFLKFLYTKNGATFAILSFFILLLGVTTTLIGVLSEIVSFMLSKVCRVKIL